MSFGAATDDLAGKVAIVTGASSGIGLAIASSLARQGARLLLAARSAERLDEAARLLGHGALAVPTDVTVASEVTHLVEVSIGSFGRVDILVANAGIYVSGDVAAGNPDEFDALLDTNVKGVVRSVHAVLGHMVSQGIGDILVTSSVSGHQVIDWEPVYSASKHALQAFAHGLRRQLATTGVRVGSIAPGMVLNDLWNVSDADQIAAAVAAGTSLRSEDVAEAAIFMLTRPRHATIRDLVMLPTNQDL